jgi:hypothetical protein
VVVDPEVVTMEADVLARTPTATAIVLAAVDVDEAAVAVVAETIVANAGWIQARLISSQRSNLSVVRVGASKLNKFSRLSVSR